MAKEGCTFEERIAKAVTEKLNDGTVEELVSDAVTKALKSSIEEQFRWNGDARKVIDEKVKEVMTPAIERVSLEDYVVKLDGTVAISSVGTQKDKIDKELFLKGYKEMIRRLEPESIIFYGNVPEECKGNIIRVKAFQEKFSEAKCDGW